MLTGVLTVDKASIQYTGSGITYDTSVASPRFYFTATGFANSTDYSHTDLSNVYVNANGPLSPTATGTSFTFYGQRVYIRDLQYDSATTFNAFATQMVNNGTPLTFVGRLREALIYQLTPVQVASLLGLNNIFADCGDSSVTYRADTELFINKSIPSVPVQDVQVNGTSILSQGVANVPVGGTNNFGVVKSDNSHGIELYQGSIWTIPASAAHIKGGTESYRVISPQHQHESIYYGLSKLAGEDLKNDTVTVGTYPEKSISAISQMLNAHVSVSGSTPSITAKPGVRYICGECATLSITAPASGCIDVVFTSGSTATVLTVTPPTGVTAIKWVGNDDPSALEANKTYEINILDGEYGVIASWA